MLVKDIPVICTYNISDVERRCKYSRKYYTLLLHISPFFVKGLMGAKGIKTLLGQDLNWFTCGPVCTDVDWQQVGGFSLKI